jgi:hypothetical protein
MDQPMTKAQLLAELQTAQTDWERKLADVGVAQMTQPGTVGDWSVKDVVFHATSYARFFVNALQAHLRGEPPPLEGTVYAAESLSVDQVNQQHFQQSQQHPLAEVLAESQHMFQQLIALIEAHPEEFLIEPQLFEGVPEAIVVWHGLHHVFEHYAGHLREIRAALDTPSGDVTTM